MDDMDAWLKQSMPRYIMEEIRTKLKDREQAHEFFNLARKAVKEGIDEITEIKTPKPRDEQLILFMRSLMLSDTLRRIDDFEMAHLNMIDIREECCGAVKPAESNRNFDMSVLVDKYVNPILNVARTMAQFWPG